MDVRDDYSFYSAGEVPLSAEEIVVLRKLLLEFRGRYEGVTEEEILASMEKHKDAFEGMRQSGD